MRRTIIAFLTLGVTATALAATMSPPHNLAEAIRSQTRRVNSRPNDARALNDLGNLLTLAGALEQAEDAYRRSLAIAPDDARTHYNLGLLLRQRGRSRAALKELQRSVKLDPDYAWGRFQFGVLLEQRGKRSKATHEMAQAFLLDPSLTRSEVNPQLLDSELVTRAMTRAYQERVASLESAPRVYDQPERIRRLLLPETVSTAPTEGEAPPDVEEARPRQRRKERKKTRSDSGGS